MKRRLLHFVYCFVIASFIVFFLCACSSNENKANKLIDKDMFSCLIDYDSYQTIETTVDSLTNQLIGDTLILDQILTYESFKRAAEYSGSKESEDIWSESRFAEYSQNEYNLLSESQKEVARDYARSTDLWSTTAANILTISKQHSDGSFYGYIVTHKFRCKNRAGQVSANSYIYFIDKDFSRIIRKFGEENLPLDKYKEMVNDALGAGEALSSKHKGERFLKENAKKEGVEVLPSGLQYKVLKQGNGKIPSEASKVLVHYDTRLIDGTVLFSNFDKEPVETSIFDQIKGMAEALSHMPTGSIWEVYIPQELAFGESSDLPGLPGLEPYSALICKVELIKIVE